MNHNRWFRFGGTTPTLRAGLRLCTPRLVALTPTPIRAQTGGPNIDTASSSLSSVKVIPHAPITFTIEIANTGDVSIIAAFPSRFISNMQYPTLNFFGTDGNNTPYSNTVASSGNSMRVADYMTPTLPTIVMSNTLAPTGVAMPRIFD